ncbi:MAG: signal peptidase I [Bacteroidota bacterium]
MNAEERKRILAGRKGSNKRSTNARNPGAGTKPGEPERSFGEEVLSWVKTIVSALLIVMVVNGLLIASFVVPTGSMENEVMAGDFLFVNKFIYGGSTPQTIPFLDTPLPYYRFPGIREPKKGDVIVFIFPGMRDQRKADEFQYYLKRCVAVAGDTLQVKNKKVFINDQEQPTPENARFEPGLPQPDDSLRTFPESAHYNRDNWGPVRIPKKGDVIQLNDSTFYRWYVFIQREGHDVEKEGQIITIDKKPTTTYTVGRDYCFGMGDNRDNSLDSRYWGFVPIENVVGTPLFVYWSWDPNLSLTQLGGKLSSIRWSRMFKGVH